MTTIITASSVTAFDNIVLANLADVYVAPDVERLSESGRALVATVGSGHRIDIMGGLYGFTRGIELTGGVSTITVGPAGSVAAGQDAINTSGSTVAVLNAGLVTGNTAILHSDDVDYSLVNTGDIVGLFGYGIQLSNVGGTVINRGTILGTNSYGIYATDSGTLDRLLEIDNSGRISDIDYGGFSGSAADGQWSDQSYADARGALGGQPYAGNDRQPLVPLTSDNMPAYPGGPVPGETYQD